MAGVHLGIAGGVVDRGERGWKSPIFYVRRDLARSSWVRGMMTTRPQGGSQVSVKGSLLASQVGGGGHRRDRLDARGGRAKEALGKVVDLPLAPPFSQIADFQDVAPLLLPLSCFDTSILPL